MFTFLSRNFFLRRTWRSYSTNEDLRTRLMVGVKLAMKSKDTVTSTTLKSVLSEVYALDKAGSDKIQSSAIASILRKAVAKRNEAAAKFNLASRQDLADKEIQESQILENFLPPLLAVEDIDAVLQDAVAALPPSSQPEKSLGQIFKFFYQKVDRSEVDTNLVKKRADILLAQK